MASAADIAVDSPDAPDRNAPVSRTERIFSIDVLRGFALLGILMVNIQSFAMISAAYGNPTAYGDFEGLNYLVWWVTYVFFDSKMMSLFSMLFGAGIVLMYERALEKTGKTNWLHYRRMFWLILFGIAHARLLWFGDILYTYGMCGLIVFWAKNWRPVILIVVGLIMVALPSGLFVVTDAALPKMEPADYQEMVSGWSPSEEKINEELATYRGGWLTQLPVRSSVASKFETFLFAILFFWRAGGLMLIGMALYKMKFLDASRSARFYLVAGVISLAVGLAIVLSGVWYLHRFEWAFDRSMFEAMQFNYWGSLWVAFGYACLVMLMCKREWLPWLRRSLQAAGQMALTNYILQTVICTLLFYGHGLGWFGSVSRSGQFAIVVLIWAMQLVLSPIWLQHFRFGPLEWLWRTLAYWKRQPMRRIA